MTTEIILLCLAAFMAGFVDAIVGGGGLIQTPAGLILLPDKPIATVIGSLKIPAFSGTFFAAIQYAKRVQLKWGLLAFMLPIALVSSATGSWLLTKVSNAFMKPVLLVVLILVALYTYLNKNFGIHSDKSHSNRRRIIYCLLISAVIGFYDGFIGPGTGSFLVLIFIGLLGFDFLNASAHAKFVNLATNLGSIIFFTLAGKIMFYVALPMAISNAVGGILGARMAILKGNKFIKSFFLVVVTGTIIRFAWDIFRPFF
ncbi:MAG: sulfite exporter TauE/SafE family protein [Flavitalea sp.]